MKQKHSWEITDEFWAAQPINTAETAGIPAETGRGTSAHGTPRGPRGDFLCAAYRHLMEGPARFFRHVKLGTPLFPVLV
jgi:hypothetical protein